MKTWLFALLLCLRLSPACAVDMTQPASVQITVQDSAGHPLPQASVQIGTQTVPLDAFGQGRVETRAPQAATDIFWTEPLRVNLAKFSPVDTELSVFPGERLALPLTLLPAATTRRYRAWIDPPPALPPHPFRLTLLTPEGQPAAGWRVGPNAYVVNSYSLTAGMVLPPIYVYDTDSFLRTNANGRVSFRQKEEHFLVVSPQGVPFLYPLHPQSWPDGLHSAALRLPPVRRTQTGRLTYENGKPAANIPLKVRGGLTAGQQWELARPETLTGTLATDAEGRYALPVYFGTGTEYDAAKRNCYAYDFATGHAVLHEISATGFARVPAEYKEVTVRFAGETGKPLPEIGMENYEVRVGTTVLASLGAEADTRGFHLFLPTSADHVDVKTKADNWNTLTKTLILPGTGDQAFTVTIPQFLHRKPLQGTVVDPSSRPVPGVSLNLYGINPRPGSPNGEFLRFSTVTDAQGRFAFAAAPDSCEIDLDRFDAKGRPTLPGWIEPPVVTPQTRRVTVRLRPFLPSTVRLLLPPSVKTEPKEIYLKSLPAGHLYPDFLFPVFDPRAHTLLWNRIPPGRYTLVHGDPSQVPAMERLDLPVALDTRETVLDLSRRPAAFPQPPLPVQTRIFVTDVSGKPVGGASVTLWTDQRPYERHLPADLTDEKGSVTLPLGRGQRGVAVAYIAGQLIGDTGLIGKEGQRVTVVMQQARTLTFPQASLPGVSGKPPYNDSREVLLRPEGIKPDEAQAVFLVLGLLSADAGFLGDGPVPEAQLPKDPNGSWAAPDLPPGTYHLQPRNGYLPAAADPAGTEVRLP